MFLEDVQGFVEVRFDGAIGSTLSFHYDGRSYEDLPNLDADVQAVPFLAPRAPCAPVAPIVPLLGMQEVQQSRNATKDAKSQTVGTDNRSVKTQTAAPDVANASVQTKTRSTTSTSVKATATASTPKPELKPSPTIVDLTEQDDIVPALKQEISNDPIEANSHHTFTSAIATIFQTFNEPRDPYRQKRQAETAADYRAYKHIFIEGYRNGDGKEEEGRLHVDLNHHVLLWKSYDDYEGGAKLTLDRLDLPRCKNPLLPTILHSTCFKSRQASLKL